MDPLEGEETRETRPLGLDEICPKYQYTISSLWMCSNCDGSHVSATLIGGWGQCLWIGRSGGDSSFQEGGLEGVL